MRTAVRRAGLAVCSSHAIRRGRPKHVQNLRLGLRTHTENHGVSPRNAKPAFDRKTCAYYTHDSCDILEKTLGTLVAMLLCNMTYFIRPEDAMLGEERLTIVFALLGAAGRALDADKLGRSERLTRAAREIREQPYTALPQGEPIPCEDPNG